MLKLCIADRFLNINGFNNSSMFVAHSGQLREMLGSLLKQQVFFCSNRLVAPVVVDAEYSLSTSTESQPTTIDPPVLEHTSRSTHHQCTLPGRPIDFLNFKQLNLWRRLLTALGEYEFYKQCCPEILMPKSFTLENLETLVNLEAKALRRKFLWMLAKNERQKLPAKNTLFLDDVIIKCLSSKKTVEHSDTDKASVQKIYLEKHWKSNRIFSTARVVRTMLCGAQFAPNVVVDFSWLAQQNALERQAVCNHFLRCCFENCSHRQQFHIFATGLRFAVLMKHLTAAKHFCAFDGFFDYFVTVSENCYTELFPREQLVYLTPDGNSVLEKFDADKVYILGGIADVFSDGISTVEKARVQGIATARLPLEKYIDMHCLYETRLPIYTVFACLLNLQIKSDISQALLEHWPQRSSPKNPETGTSESRYAFVKRKYRRKLAAANTNDANGTVRTW